MAEPPKTFDGKDPAIDENLDANRKQGAVAVTQRPRPRTDDIRSSTRSFGDLLVPDTLVAALHAAGYSTPSPVQQVVQS
jgi:superfamily II DNA/RNA helicase